MLVFRWAIVFVSATLTVADYLRNDNHIFNTVTSAMRQWGSSLNHNGMSYFMASVPKATLLYHGRSNDSVVKWTEWFAFEPEHAINFAFGPGHRHGPPEKRPGKPPGKPPKKLGDISEPRLFSARNPQLQRPMSGLPRHHPPFADANEEDPDFSKGHFQTYRARHDLKVLYIDGMSAGKTELGTTDTQDLVLINRTCSNCTWIDERERAGQLCSLNREMWNNTLDGFLRMETGFEIIICDAGKSLELVSQVQTSRDDRGDFHTWTWLEAAAARYMDIGGDRVSVDFANMVSAYNLDNTDLFVGGKHPRLKHLSSSLRERLFVAVYHLVMQTSAETSSVHLQAKADMIVSRYAQRLETLHRTDWKALNELHQEILSVYSPFIDYSKRSRHDEIERCQKQSLSYQTYTGTVGKSLESISLRICTTLMDVLGVQDLTRAAWMIQELYEHLDWAVWKDCRGCQAGEVCLIPMWPFGSQADYDQPHCRNKEAALEQRGYWGPMKPSEVS